MKTCFKRVVITSGPTLEPIDPVRYISNRSSGKSGLHLANEARKRGYGEIIFITGPTCYLPQDITIRPVETALQMQAELNRFVPGAQAVIMASAVSDYRVVRYSETKIKKNRETMTLELVKNPDLLFQLGQDKKNHPHLVLVGYAAETHDFFENARGKFQRKNLDMLVLNRVAADNPAFNTDDNQVYFFTAAGMRELEKMEKSQLATHIWDEVERIYNQKQV